MARILMTAAVALLLTACDEHRAAETDRTPSYATVPADRSTDRVVNSSELPEDQTPLRVDDEAVEAVQRFVAALAAGDLEQAERFFISEQAFKQTFAGENLDSYYASLRQKFRDSLREHAPMLKGAEFVRFKLETEGQRTPYPAGASFGEARFARETVTVNDPTAIVKLGDRAVGVHLETLLQTQEGWRVIEPITVQPAVTDRPPQ